MGSNKIEVILLFYQHFRYLRNVKTAKLGGALVLKADNTSGEVSLMWGHSSWCMGVGYMKKGDKKVHVSF